MKHGLGAESAPLGWLLVIMVLLAVYCDRAHVSRSELWSAPNRTQSLLFCPMECLG
jgi:hypothetical protein